MIHCPKPSLVEGGVSCGDNFRDVTFAVHLGATQNRRFFEDTAVVEAAAEELARPATRGGHPPPVRAIMRG